MKNYFFREAEISDVDMIYKWANDDLTRKNSFNSNKIKYEDHLKWFSNICKSENEELFIFYVNDSPVGQIRFTRDDSEATISYNIDVSQRGQGYGKLMLEKAIDFYKDKHQNLKALIAKVKPNNKASMKCFKDIGFKDILIEYHLDVSQ